MAKWVCPKKSAGTLCLPHMGVNRVRMGKRLFLHLSLRYYKCFLLPCGSGKSWDDLSRAVSVVPALLVPGELLVSPSYFLPFLYCCFFPTPFLLKQTRIKGRVYHSLPLGMVDLQGKDSLCSKR